jgi:hypothetical protein
MAKHVPPTDRELYDLEALACDATPGPWEAQTVLDYQSGGITHVVAHVPPGSDQFVYVVDGGGEMSEEDQRYVAALHPDAALRLVKEIRRLRKVEERYDSLRSVLQHLNTFLERRGLVAQAQRFVEVRAQLEMLHPDALDGEAAAAAPPARRHPEPVTLA